jgi:hypothetical protein
MDKTGVWREGATIELVLKEFIDKGYLSQMGTNV